MQRPIFKRVLSIVLAAALIFALGEQCLAVGSESTGQAGNAPVLISAKSEAPPLRYYVTNVGWRYAEAVPLYNETRETFYLDKDGSENAVVAAEARISGSPNNGILSQFAPESSEVKLSGAKTLDFSSAKLFYFFPNEITGYINAELFVKADRVGSVKMTVEIVLEDGSAVTLAEASAEAVAGEQKLSLALKRAYDNEKDDFDFVAYQLPSRKGGTVRALISGDAGMGLTVYTGGSKASSVSVPFTDDDETGYNGKLTVDGGTYNATMYWLPNTLYINYSKSAMNDSWLSVPASSSYTVDKNGAAVFDGFTFIAESNGLKNGIEQEYDGSGKHTQPFPTVRHVIVDTVPVEEVPDLLYMPAEKTLHYDLFMPTGGWDGTPPPVIIFLHGYSGSYATLEQFMIEMLNSGYAVAGVDFRRSPSNFSPDFDHDIKGTIRNLRANAAKLGIDGDRIGVYGASNGGFTSLMMLLTNENDEFMEGTVGGNLGVSSRVQAGLVGYGASDYLYFGADQRTDNANNEDLLRGMITGGDGEMAPCAQMTGWYGVGKGLLMLRNYKEAREAAEAEGRLSEFLSTDYVYVVDEEYLQKWFPWNLGGGLFQATLPATIGTYTYTHAELEKALEDTALASPITWVSPDDSPVGMFAGYGGTQNITHTQSTRTLQALSEAGVEGFLYSNTLGNYGREDIVKAAMKNFLDEYLMLGTPGAKIVLTLDKETAAVNYRSVKTAATLKKVDGRYMIPLDFVLTQLGMTPVPGSSEGVRSIGGALYADADTVKKLTGATVTEWPDFDMVSISKASATVPAKSPVVKPGKVSTYGQYSGYSGTEYPGYVRKSCYVEVPAFYEGAYASDPEHKYWQDGDMIKLAVDYVLPADGSGNAIEGRFPVVLMCSRDNRFQESNGNGNGAVAINLVKHGYAYMCISMRGCGASEGINNSFSSLENRFDIKYIMENWAPQQSWYNGSFAMMGGSNRGLIQGAAAAADIKGLKAITPVVCDMDFYYQNFPNGVSAALTGMNGVANTTGLSGTNKDTEVKSYEDWLSSTKVQFVDEDLEGRIAYGAYVIQTKENMSFSTYLILPNMCRDTENKFLYNEKVEQTIAPMEYTAAIKDMGIKTHQLAGYYDSNATLQLALANTWDESGTIVMGPWNHSGAIVGSFDEGRFPNSTFNVAEDYLRWFDYALKGIDNGYDQAPRYYYYVVGAAKGSEWRYADAMQPDDAIYSTLYLAPESADIDVASALRLSGSQSNNGKLTLDLPETSAAQDYRVDTDVVLPDDFNAFHINSFKDMRETVDSHALTYTSAPVGRAFEIVGIPTIDLWVSSNDTNDCDFLAYLELVDADGTSHYLSRSFMRASHRETGANLMWDSTPGLAGRFHPSTTDSMANGLEAGMSSPVHLEFVFDFVSVNVKAGQSLRVSVTCANTALDQHYMLYDYDEAKGEYILKTGDALPVISLYTGGDKASHISLPVVQKNTNVFNGTVSLFDGSYTGPGTMYLFKDNWYLNYNGCWKKLPVSSELCRYSVKKNKAVFANAGFSFIIEGSLVNNSVAQSYTGGAANAQPFPTKYHLFVDKQKVTGVHDMLYLPAEMNLYIDLFSPDYSTGKDPLIVFVHGFGGTTTVIDDFLNEAVMRGYAVAGIDLRTSPPNFSPDFYHDIKGDVRYLRANASALGVDPDKFCSYGQSMGGYTAMILAISDGSDFLEGTVGGNAGVASGTQGGIIGYAASDYLYFGFDQRRDNAGNLPLLASMITGGDGENAPCAQTVDWYGPGKGFLMLRNYIAAREEAEANGTLSAFLARDYTFTIDDAYIKYWFPSVTDGLFASGAAATPGTYTFSHAELEAAIERAQRVSPYYYIDADDVPLVFYGGFGGRQNITNSQSIRSLSRYQDVGAKAFYVGNSLNNYGREESNRAMFWKYLATYFPAYGNPGVAFSDVRYGEYYYNAVQWAVDNGVTKGTGLLTFSPDLTCTRAQAMTMIWRAAGCPKAASSTTPFTDVAQGEYYYEAVLWAVEQGITNGTSATTFSPADYCTRAQVVTFMHRFEKTPSSEGASNPFADVSQSDYFYNAVLWAVKAGVTTGTSATAFSPGGVCTRAQIITFLFRDLA